MATSSSSAKKRKHVVLTIDSKLAILDRLKEGVIHAKLADEYGIGIGDIKKDEAKIRSFASIICECLDYFTCTWYMYIQ